ncbi:MAG: hypothetical protein K2Y37_25935 [Pirellulales bacterium]|nr:hypothetical protein [Pirellulales bacterium]
MNKAFVREPDDNGQRQCPRCGSLGEAVGPGTVAAHLPGGAESGLADAAFFCPYATCEVAYFDLFERVLTTDRLSRAVWPKDPGAPICACFGFTRDEIEADVREGSVRRTRELVDRAKSPAAHCATASASGRSCVADVQRYYMKLRDPTQV